MPQATHGCLRLQLRPSVRQTSSPWSLLFFVHSMKQHVINYCSLWMCAHTPPHIQHILPFMSGLCLASFPFLMSPFSYSCLGLASLALPTISLASVLAHMQHWRCSCPSLRSERDQVGLDLTPCSITLHQLLLQHHHRCGLPCTRCSWLLELPRALQVLELNKAPTFLHRHAAEASHWKSASCVSS